MKRSKNIEASLSELKPELRNNPELFIQAITTLMELYGYVILDCGCKAIPPNANVTIVELADGSYIAVCKECEDNVWEDENYIGSLPTRLTC